MPNSTRPRSRRPGRLHLGRPLLYHADLQIEHILAAHFGSTLGRRARGGCERSDAIVGRRDTCIQGNCFVPRKPVGELRGGGIGDAYWQCASGGCRGRQCGSERAAAWEREALGASRGAERTVCQTCGWHTVIAGKGVGARIAIGFAAYMCERSFANP